MIDLGSPPPRPVRWSCWLRVDPRKRVIVTDQLAFGAKQKAAVLLETDPGAIECEAIG